MLADEDDVNEAESILYPLSDVLTDEIHELVRKWNKQNSKIQVEISEPYGIINIDDLIKEALV